VDVVDKAITFKRMTINLYLLSWWARSSLVEPTGRGLSGILLLQTPRPSGSDSGCYF